MRASAVDDALPSVAAPPGWTLGRPIAIGGSSLVYSMTNGTGAPALLKYGRWRDRDIHERFAHEAAILRALGAPVTPTYIAHGAIADWPYLVMEEIAGETLAAWMSRMSDRGALGEIVAILLRLAGVLRAIHAAGFVHRDLKPENVMIGSRDTRILDFGLAIRDGDGITEPGAVIGTAHYLAPEQVRTGASIDRRADLYSFGVMAYEMIAGQPPFVGERRALEYQHQVVRPPALREIRQLPEQLEQIVTACLAKEPDARPQTADVLIEQLTHASTYIQTLKGVVNTPRKVLGARDNVVLAWIENGDPITVSRAINDVHGIIVRSRPSAILAAFAGQFHDRPLAVALGACRDLAHDRCRIVIHMATVLVRRSAQGKPAFYGPEIEQTATWLPAAPFTGMVLSAAAAELSPTPVAPVPEVPGFFRDVERDRTDDRDAQREPTLVGRDRILQDIAAIARAGGMLIGISGPEGSGKTRLLAALSERLRGSRRAVIAIRGRRRLLGDLPDDDRLREALGDGSDLAQGLAGAARRNAIIVVDDAQWFSAAARTQLVRDDVAATRVITSNEPLFEVAPGVTRRLAISLSPLSFGDAERLLRELLEPARLIPEVLLQRLSIRGAGSPGLLVALARDIKHRGGIRRQPGSDDWYVAADEIDTLLAAPSAAWIANRGLESLAIELAPLVRTAAGLGPKFGAEELAAIIDVPSLADRLHLLVRDGVFSERNGWFEFVDASLQDAIYDHALDDREAVHARALRYWLEHRRPGLVGWLARVNYHATGCGELATAAACSTILAREARKRGETDQAAELETRILSSLVGAAPGAVSDVVRALEDDG